MAGIQHATQTSIADDPAYDVGANEWNADHTITGTINPTSNDGAALGTSALSFSDLFLADGGFIDWNNSGGRMYYSSGSDTVFIDNVEAVELDLSGAATGLSLVGINEGAAGPVFNTTHVTTTQAQNDIIGAYYFYGYDSGQNLTNYCSMLCVVDVPTNTLESAFFKFSCQVAGTMTTQLLIGNGMLLGGGNFPGTNCIAANGTITAYSLTSIPSGGTTGAGFKLSTTSNFGMFFGSGAPTLSAAQGSLYLRSDGSSTSTRLYVNTNGTTGWTNVTTAT